MVTGDLPQTTVLVTLVTTQWTQEEQNLAVGQLVIVLEDNIPQHWPLARVVYVTSGHDRKVCVAEIMTFKRVFKRPVIR